MYSKEDKERHLADLRESGMPANRFAKQPGRPSRFSLLRWRKEAEAGLLDVPEREVRGRVEHCKHALYPEATKREALALLARGMRPCDIARRLGLQSGSVIGNWKRAAERDTMSAEVGPMGDAGRKAGAARPGELEARIAELELEVAVLKEMVRDPKAGGPARLSNRRKAELGERLRRDSGTSLKDVLRALRISKSTYEYQRAAIARGTPDADARRDAVALRVRRAFEASGRRYGYRRVRASILAGADGGEPMRVSEAEVRAAMRAGDMVARRTRRRTRWSSYAGEVDGRPPNVPLAPDGTHDFGAGGPGEVFVTDVTEFRVGAAKVYLSPFIDCFDGMPVAWASSLHPDSELCDGSLEGMLGTLPEGSAPTVHTDGGAVYRSGTWKAICAENGVTRSMSRKACCQDNARAEGFFGTLKEEFYHGRDWSGCPPSRFMEELDGYIEWYRDVRLKAFEDGDGRVVYDTISGRRRRLGYVV